MSNNWQAPSSKQLDSIISANSPYNVWIGSVRSGKTVGSIIRWLMFVREAPEGDLLMVGATLESLQRNILNPIRDLVGQENFKQIINMNVIYIFGRKIYVAGCPDIDSVNRITGMTLIGAYVDEIILMPKNYFEMLLSRLSLHGAKLFATTNPGSPSHYLKAWIDDIGVKRSLSLFEFRLDDNPFLPQDYKERLKANYSGIFYKRFVLGEWVAAEGAVYDMFDDQVHVINEGFPESYDSFVVAIDWGMSNATSFLMLGLKNNKVYCLKEYYYTNRGRDFSQQKSPNEFVDDFKAFVNGYRLNDILIDPSAKAFTSLLQRAGFRPRNASNSVVEGINLVQSFFSSQRLYISTHCKNLIKELHGYCWDEKKSLLGVDAPVKIDDHLCDCLRYGVYTIFKRNGIQGTYKKPVGW